MNDELQHVIDHIIYDDVLTYLLVFNHIIISFILRIFSFTIKVRSNLEGSEGGANECKRVILNTHMQEKKSRLVTSKEVLDISSIKLKLKNIFCNVDNNSQHAGFSIMRINENTLLEGDKVVLVPYNANHVPR